MPWAIERVQSLTMSIESLAEVRQLKSFLVIFKKNIFDASQSEVILGTISP